MSTMNTLQTTTRIEDLNRGRLLPVHTDGMEPTLLERGYAVVAPCDRITSDGVYALMHRDGVIIRRCQLLVDGGVRLMLDNEKYTAAAPDIMTRSEVDTIVLGRVCGSCNPI